MTRSQLMARVKSQDTNPERLVAERLRAAKVRFRRNVKSLPGRPDFYIPHAEIVIFVHGCWWHGHDCPRGDRTPQSNRDYWLAKIDRNRRRDRRVARELRAAGYSVWTLWECRLNEALPKRLMQKLQR
jgi:DNA mismatch endonuclease (patch repair protein)